jgi:hypothetical protein
MKDKCQLWLQLPARQEQRRIAFLCPILALGALKILTSVSVGKIGAFPLINIMKKWAGKIALQNENALG